MVGAASAENRVLVERAQARNCFPGVEDVRLCSLNRIDILTGEGGDTAKVLHQIQDDTLATEQHASVMADDGKNLSFMDSYAVEDLRMADDFVARVRWRTGIQTGEDFKKARNCTQPGEHQVLAGDDR